MRRVLLDRDVLVQRVNEIVLLAADLNHVPQELFIAVMERYGELLAWIAEQPSTDM